MPFADVNGQHIRYEDTGSDKPAVLCSHGFLMNHRMFDPQVAALGDSFRMVRWDERGFGETPAQGPFTYWDSADDAVALLDHLQIEQAVFMGMSQGGYLSLRAALRYPDRVRALVLIDTSHDLDPPEGKSANRELLEAWCAGALEQIAPTVAGIILGPEEHWEPWKSSWKSIDLKGFKFAGDCLMERDDIKGRVKDIKQAALIVHGTEDVAISLDRAKAMAAALPGFRRLVEVEGAAHAPNLTHPDAVNPAVLEFLRSL